MPRKPNSNQSEMINLTIHETQNPKANEFVLDLSEAVGQTKREILMHSFFFSSIFSVFDCLLVPRQMQCIIYNSLKGLYNSIIK